MAEWRSETVEMLVSSGTLRIEDGNHGEYRPRPDEFDSHGTPYVRAADVDHGQVKFSTASRINGVALMRIRKGIGRDLDVLLTHKGTVGRVAQVPVGSPAFVCSPQTTFWRSLDHELLDPGYLRVAMGSPDFIRQLTMLMSNTDMAPYVSLTQQRGMSLLMPPPAEQRAIAEVLGALDDKIAANTRLATTADELVRAMWSVVALDADGECDLGALGTSVRSQVDPSDIPAERAYVGLEHIPRRSMWLSDRGSAGSVSSAKSEFATDDVLFGKLRPYFHKVVAAPVDGICSTDVLVLRARSADLAGYLLAAASSDEVVAAATAASEGTRMPRTSWSDLGAVSIPWPGEEAARAFSQDVVDIRRAVEGRVAENLTLAATRDALLPALMSGALRVRDTGDPVSDRT